MRAGRTGISFWSIHVEPTRRTDEFRRSDNSNLNHQLLMVMFIRFDHMLIDHMKECDSVVKNYKRTTCNSGLEAAYTTHNTRRRQQLKEYTWEINLQRQCWSARVLELAGVLKCWSAGASSETFISGVKDERERSSTQQHLCSG